jgi:alpha 1,3-glucosidase
VTIPTPINEFPLLIQGGHIVTTRERVRRTSSLMWQDPFTVTIALGRDGAAAGQLYIDDGETFGFQNGEYVHRAFAFTPAGKGGKGMLASRQFVPHDAKNAYADKVKHVLVERIDVLGATAEPSSVTVAGKPVEFTYTAPEKGTEAAPGIITIKNPGVAVTNDWEVVIA